jgi:serine/threonine protein kinase/predicted negative regulator of RcsB-dependent stress response/predicted transcriptional regulator
LAARRDNKVVAEEWERVKELFESALDHPPQERAELLSRLGQDDPALARQVSNLIVSHEQAGDFLQQPLIFAASFLEDLEEPQRFAPDDVLCNRFKIVRLIGKGGMGEVYEAFDQELEERVALKTLRFEVSSNEIFTARFRREIQLARKVTHPNVCRIFESLRHQAGNEAISVLSMELLQGQTLGDYLKSKGRLTAEEALPLARQIIDGLSAVHAAGIIHRDLKPSNLILVPEGSSFLLKITDFGIAGRPPENSAQTALTQASKMLGTPDYMAPEQLEQGRATVQSDIYALGLVLYEMVTGAKPFAEAGAWRRLMEEAPPAKKFAPKLPESWIRTISCCLERKPAFRFRDVESAGQSLEPESGPGLIPQKPLPVRLKTAARKGRWAIVALLVVSAALTRLALQPKLENGATVLFPEIENTTSDQQLEAVTDLMRNQLEQSPTFSLLDRSQMNNQLRQMGKPIGTSLSPEAARQLALRAGARLLLLTTLSQRGSGYDLSVRVEEISTSPDAASRQWEKTFTASNKQHLFGAVQEASRWFRRLAENTPFGKLQNDNLPQAATTSSWEALLSFSQAERLRAAGQTQQAIDLLLQGVALDDDFSLAHMRLGDLYDSMGAEKKGFAHLQKAKETLEKRGVTQKEGLRIQGLFAQDTGNFKEAEKVFQQFELLYPHDYLASFYLASTQEDLGQFSDALETFERAGQKQPDAYTPIAHEARMAMVLGKFEIVDNALQRLRTMHRDGAADSAEVGYRLLRQDFPAALQALARLQGSPDPFYKSKSYVIRAALLRELGRDQAAIQALKAGIKFDQGEQFTLNEVAKLDEADKWVALAYIYWRTNDLARCREAALRVLKLEDGRLHVLQAGTLLARAGFVADARDALGMLASKTGLQAVDQAWYQLHGEILAAQHKRAEAVAEMRKAAERDIPASEKEYLARVLAAEQDRGEATQLYRKMAESPAEVWQALGYRYPGLWADMATQYERLATTKDSTSAKVRNRRENLRRFSEIPAVD